MKNFIFISPNFPLTYWRFCKELKNNGLRVLGIGDCPYNELTEEQRNSMHEYYKVSSLENYDEVFRAVAFFTFKYGKIDWLESNNEYWLERDAKLRTEFHITSGFQEEDMVRTRYKSGMKAFYAKAGIPTARYHLVKDYEPAREFANKVGYPVVVKPDNGVGANATYKLKTDADLEFFFATKDNSVQYIMEEFVNGEVRTYDAIIDSKGEPVFESGNVTCDSLMDVVNEAKDSIFYIVKELPETMKQLGRRTVKAFGVKSRFVHFEYFVLKADQEGLGKKGDIFGLEVNMRPPGGYTPDMMNWANDIDVYQIWANMVCYDQGYFNPDHRPYSCVYAAQRKGNNYAHNHDDIFAAYGSNILTYEEMPEVIATAMADYAYLARFETEEQCAAFADFVLKKC